MPRTVGDLEANGFTKVIVHCVGQHAGDRRRCWHVGRLALEGLPRMALPDLCPWFRCTECGNAGFVNLAIDWGEIIDYSTRDGTKKAPPAPQGQAGQV